MARRKKRTRGHIIADISENHFEKYALSKGFSIERTAHDYGYDVFLFSYDKNGEIENGYISVQLKATDKLPLINQNTIISFPVDKKDIDLWINEFNPVILVVYDAINKKGYWINIQSYFQSIPNFSIAKISKTTNVHLPITNKIGKATMSKFAQQKTLLYAQLSNIKH